MNLRKSGYINKYVSLCILLFCISFVYSTEPNKIIRTGNHVPKSPLMRTRASISPVISFYRINKNHAGTPSQKMSGLISVKEEIRLNEKHTVFFLIGAEYMVHGLNFASYYFKPDSIHLYTGSFDYTYSLYIHEIDIPIQMKLSFGHENNKIFTGYFMLGYHFRELITGKLKVKQNGEVIEKKNVDVTFKNPLITPRNNPFISLTLGLQKNHPNNTRRCIFAEASFRFGISPYQITDSFAPSSLYINGNHLVFSLGMKF